MSPTSNHILAKRASVREGHLGRALRTLALALGFALADGASAAGEAAIVFLTGVGTNTRTVSNMIFRNCTPGGLVTALTQISGGSMGNKITGTASCRGKALATTTAVDPSGANDPDADSNFNSNKNNLNTNTGGTPQCKHQYTAAGTPQSAWVVVCVFY